MKAYDWQVLIEHLAPYLFAGVYDDVDQQSCLMDILGCLRELAARRVPVNGLAALETRIVETISRAEIHLPLTELGILFHSMVHLPAQIRRWGPSHGTWMYDTERCVQLCFD
jgi:hypothetical protein